MNRYMKWMGLVVAMSALTGCAAVPPSKPLTYGQTPDSVRDAVHQGQSQETFVLSDGGSDYRFESVQFEDAYYINYWFVYRDGVLYAVVGHKEVDVEHRNLGPPCSAGERATWLELAKDDHAQDLASYDFRDTGNYPKEIKQTGIQQAGVVFLTTVAVALYVEYPVLLALPIGLMTPDAVMDLKPREYADHAEFGAGQDVIRSRVGSPDSHTFPSGDCEVDRYGGSFFGRDWVEYWYLDGRLLAVEHGPD